VAGSEEESAVAFEVLPVKGQLAGAAVEEGELPPPSSLTFSTLAQGFQIFRAIGCNHLCQM
jgi:hypothetical protein